jgi:hypothetical protein
VHLTRQRGLKMAIIGSDAPEFYKLVSIILIYLKMPVYVGNVIFELNFTFLTNTIQFRKNVKFLFTNKQNSGASELFELNECIS